jgi:hypothetical protein
VIGALEHVLAGCASPRHIEFATGLKAAQRVYRSAASAQATHP